MADRKSASDAEEEKPKKKKPRVLQKYRAEYALKYPVIRKSTVGETYANCTVCSSFFSIAHGGIGDADRHVRTAKHVAKVGSNAYANIATVFLLVVKT